MSLPFLKWAGNKQAIAKHVRAHLPPGKRLIEPFAGSAAIFLATDYSQNVVNDVNEDLYRLYTILKKEGESFIGRCEKLFTDENNTEERFYELRSEFNELQAELGELPREDSARRAALFVYLNRHCFNGLCRYNQSGGFNVPYGRYSSPSVPRERMFAFYKQAQNAEFTCRDFQEVMEEAGEGDVVYCDPPYVPLSKTSNFTSYAAGGFSAEDQKRLARAARDAAERGAVVLISNHDTPFTREIYQGADFCSFLVQRYISADGENREKAKEIMALFGADMERPCLYAEEVKQGELQL